MTVTPAQPHTAALLSKGPGLIATTTTPGLSCVGFSCPVGTQLKRAASNTLCIDVKGDGKKGAVCNAQTCCEAILITVTTIPPSTTMVKTTAAALAATTPAAAVTTSPPMALNRASAEIQAYSADNETRIQKATRMNPKAATRQDSRLPVWIIPVVGAIGLLSCYINYRRMLGRSMRRVQVVEPVLQPEEEDEEQGRELIQGDVSMLVE